MNIEFLSFYAKKFSKLRVDRSRGVAPHKPILLLSIIALIEQGIITTNQIDLSPELIAMFLKLWSCIGSEAHQPDIALPYFHLRRDKFWHHLPNAGYEILVESKVKIRTISALREAVKCAYFDTPLYELLEIPTSRRSLTDILIHQWFRNKDSQIRELLQIDAFKEYQNRFRENGGSVYTIQDLENQEENVLRDSAFRKVLVSLYDYRCVFCRMKVISDNGQNIVDAAHIKPFAEFRDDRLDNGLSLCKNHHWAFDHGWFGIDDDFKIIIPEHRLVEDEAVGSRPMIDFNQSQILLPSLDKYFPRQDALRWHRERWLMTYSS
ncbi:MAG: HNH endonuclease [Cyanophyceae cyanobacterium]